MVLHCQQQGYDDTHEDAGNPEFWTMAQPGHLIPLIISFTLFLLSVLFPATNPSYVTCQVYMLNIFLPVRVRNGLSKLRSGFVLQLASVCPNKVG